MTEVDTMAPEAEAPTLTLEELTAQHEALTAKYERAQKDLSKHRTRADELEAARKAAEEKTLSEKSLQEQLEATKAKLTEHEKLAAEASERATAAERRAALAGKVKDTDYALFKLNQAPEKYLKDGRVDVDAFLKAHPDHAVSHAGPAPTPGGGGGAKKVDMNTVIRDAIRKA